MVRTFYSLLCALLLLGWSAPTSASLYASGYNASGQLGDGTTITRSTPVSVNGLGEVATAAGGMYHGLALLADGTVRAWGDNYSGQLGDGTRTPRATSASVSGLSGVAAIAGGGDHGLALLLDGTVRAWGYDCCGQLGDGSTTDRLTSVPVGGLSGVVAIAGGFAHSLALLADGTVRAWGSNSAGQLGDGTTITRLTPVPVSGLSGVVAIAAGNSHSLALLADGTVRAWGSNSAGQLGDGTTITRLTPVPVSALGGVVAIAGGGHHSLVLLPDGTVRAWGQNNSGQLGDGTTINRLTPVPVSDLGGVVAIAGGGYHSLALLTDGSVRAWGENSSGQLGDGTTTERLTPVPVSGLSGVVGIAGGVYHSLIIITKDDFIGATGIDAPPDRRTAITTAATTGVDDPTLSCVNRNPSNTIWYSFQPVSGGRLTITTAGSDYETVVAVFTGTRGALTERGCNHDAGGVGQSAVRDIPVTAGTLYYIEVGSASPGGGSLVLATSFIPAVTPDTVFGWGTNISGQLGDGTMNNNRMTPVPANGLEGVTAIAGGETHSLALLPDGTVSVWGANDVIVVGGGLSSSGSIPLRVSGLSGAVAIAGGGYHSLALLADGTVRSWGSNTAGQLGDGTKTNRPIPVPVTGLSGVVAIAAGRSHSLAFLADGRVGAWGGNSNGQLGDGTTTSRTTPVAVSGLNGPVAIAGGDSHSLALLADGTVRAWGWNLYGQLGDETMSSRTIPVPVTGLSGVVAIAAGSYHNLALLADGSVRAWGNNYYGQLGDGTKTSRGTPVPVSGLSGVVAIAAGSHHSLALLADGRVSAWGEDSYGQLGDGTAADRSVPVPVTGLSGVVAIAAGSGHSLAITTTRSIVNRVGMGSGIVTSTPAGFTCRNTCALDLPPGSGVILTATPDPGSVFAGWSGACSGTGHCVLELTWPRTVQATFDPAPLPQIHPRLSSVELGVGDSMAVTASITRGAPTVADVYVALQLPDTSLLCLRGDGQLAPTCQPLVSNWTVVPFTGPLFTYTFTGSEPAGTYRWLAALTAPGTLTPLTGITETAVSVWPTSEPALRTYLNSQSFRPGAPLTVGLSLDAPPGPLDRDVYVALQFPDGSLRFLDEAGQVTPTATPYLRHWTGAALVRKAFAYTFTGGESVGTYRWLAAFAEPGTLNFVGPIVQALFSFMP